jgi:hypothetical protein
MDEILLLMVLLFAAYLFFPKTWYPKFLCKGFTDTSANQANASSSLLPEDSVLRRHFITQLRSEIELELFPRPTDATLQRHYDALVETKLENRLTRLFA